jgi:sec-independent protein translocase protein TatB
MESFFGIGVFELVFIFIFALIFLGPERLPQVMRQVLGFIRQVRELSSDITKQINDEFGDLGELDPRRQVKQMMDEVTTPVKKELNSTAKTTTTPKSNPNATPKKLVVKTEPVAKPVAKTVPAQKSADAEISPESVEKVDSLVVSSAQVAATTESTVEAAEGIGAETSPNGIAPGSDHQNHMAVAKPQDGDDEEKRTIAPPSLQQEAPARVEESEAKRERMTQRAAEEGSV